MKRIFSRNQESGRSMIEMVGVLAVTGLITAAAFVLIRTGMSSEKINTVSDEVDILASNIRVVVAGGHTCSLPATSEITSSDSGGINFAKALLKASSAITPFGGSSYYAVTRSGSGTCTATKKTDTGFKIYLVDIPATACSALDGMTYAGGTAACGTGGTTLTITYSE